MELPIEAPVEPVATSPAAVRPDGARRILVVDDDEDVREVLVEMLAADGHAVDAAADGWQALARLEMGTYDAILSDIKIPGLDGPTFYRAVTEKYPALARRFVFLTGDTLNPATSAFLAEVCAPNFQKPFSPETMRAALAQIDDASSDALRGAPATPALA